MIVNTPASVDFMFDTIFYEALKNVNLVTFYNKNNSNT